MSSTIVLVNSPEMESTSSPILDTAETEPGKLIISHNSRWTAKHREYIYGKQGGWGGIN